MGDSLHGMVRDYSFILKLLDHGLVLLVNHLSVKLPKLVKHCLILYVGEVSPGSREEYCRLPS